jgi:hypothetical protein
LFFKKSSNSKNYGDAGAMRVFVCGVCFAASHRRGDEYNAPAEDELRAGAIQLAGRCTLYADSGRSNPIAGIS